MEGRRVSEGLREKGVREEAITWLEARCQLMRES